MKKQPVVDSIPWSYQGVLVTPESIPSWAIGYIYKISKLDEWGNVIKIYIGKKVLQSKRRTRIGVRAKKATKTRKTFQTTVKDSGWQHYWSSSNELKEDVKKCGEMAFKREIVEWAWSKKYLSFAEVEWQIKLDVLRKDTYNGNILSRFFKRDLIKPTEQ